MPATERLPALDALRGLIMVFMALDHATAFVARAHVFEFWGEPPSYYASALPFVTRLVSHLCAPGFFFLMGVGMTLFAESRRRVGWPERRIRRHFIQRGLVLLAVEQLIENPAWLLGTIGASEALRDAPFRGVPGGGSEPMLMLGVLFALAGSMIVWATLLRAPAPAVVALSVVAIALTQLSTPGAADVAVLYSPLLRLLLIPGHTNIWAVLYPVIPWLGLTGLGVAFGTVLLRDSERAEWVAGVGGSALLVLFLALRLNGLGDFHQMAQPGWIGVLNVTKYPPSVAFVLLTLGVNALLLVACTGAHHVIASWGRPLLTFGRTPLFFYLTHLYLFAVIGFAFPTGTTLGRMYPVWFAGLVAMYPLCRWYEGFKRGQPPDSLWRLF